MLIDKKIIKNYTTSLMAQTNQLSDLKSIVKDLKATDKLLNTQEHLSNFLLAPIISYEDKWEALQNLIKSHKITHIAKNFLYVLTKNSRISLISDIIHALEANIRNMEDIKYVEVFSCNELSKAEKIIIDKFLEKKLSQKIEINNKINKNLLGGILIKYDSTVIDCSISGAIHKFAQLVVQ
jgi:F-type H+-transporting ATPase subunit delta